MEKENKSPDYVLLIVTALLLGIGIIMVFSASTIISQVQYGDSYYFLKRQSFWAFIGLLGMLLANKINYWKWEKLAIVFLILNFVFLALVFVPGLGRQVYGAYRWIQIGGINFQPTEFTKLALIIFTAAHLSKGGIVKSFTKGIFPPIFFLGLSFILILRQPDMGTAVAISACIVTMLFVAGMRITHLAGFLAATVPVGLALILQSDYRRERLLSFINPWEDHMETGYQIIQSLYALGPGGLAGVGLGQSRQKFFYLPEPHNDFIFAIIGEELGFLGASFVLILFFIFIWRGFRIAAYSPDLLGSLLAAGITSIVGIQALMNIGVVTASIPVTGINLPLVSAGGSSLFFTLTGIGILLNISKHITK